MRSRVKTDTGRSYLHTFTQQLALGDVRRSDGSGGVASHSRSVRGMAKTTGGEMLPAKTSKQYNKLSAKGSLRGRALEHFSGAVATVRRRSPWP
jgi:hypothetical protein